MKKILIRQCTEPTELQACVDLQRETWGGDYVGLLTPGVLWFLNRIGGIAIAGFTADEKIVGMVLGVTGVRDGSPVHWSHMLAVRPEARHQRLAYNLKQAQRQILLSQGIDCVHGTFDPLNVPMASLLLNRLAATAGEYVREAYSGSTSPLHKGIGTDRLISEWKLTGNGIPHGNLSTASAPLVNPVFQAGEELHCRPPDLSLSVGMLRIAVPADIGPVQLRSSKLALEWRVHTRDAFEFYLSIGYRTIALQQYPSHCEYVLVR